MAASSVTWADTNLTAGDTELAAMRGQMFNADGSKAGGEFASTPQRSSNSRFRR